MEEDKSVLIGTNMEFKSFSWHDTFFKKCSFCLFVAFSITGRISREVHWLKATCPECYFEFDVEGEVMIGEIIDCPDCGVELEVVSVDEDKVVLQTVAVEEDWGE